MYRLGLDIGGTKIGIGITDEEGKLLAKSRLSVEAVTDVFAELKKAVLSLAEDTGISFGEIVSCGVGIPGTVSEDGRRVLLAPNIAILSENFADDLESTLGIPVRMVQDSRAAALGEYLAGAGKGKKALVCVTLGTGIGTGIVIDGKIYHGALGAAGELGHMPVVEGGRACGCGKRGCLEKYCAGRGLSISAAELLGEGKDCHALFREAESGNAAAQAVINSAVLTLGRALTAIVNLLSPDALLFSGGLSKEEELYLNPIIDYIKAHAYSSGALPLLSKAALGEDSPLVGAALFPTTLA